MDLTPTASAARSKQICDAFCPSGDGLTVRPSLACPTAVVAAISRSQPAAFRAASSSRRCLSLWDSVALGALGGAGFKRWSSLSADQRERVLLAWADSRAPQRRAVFQALRKAALLFYYTVPGPGGARNPAWDAVGYDGPLGVLPDARPRKALSPRVPLDGRDLEARLRRRDRRLGRRRRRHRGGADAGRPRRDRGRDGRLLRRPGLRRFRAEGPDPVLHGRSQRDPRPERLADRRVVSGRGDGRQLLDVVPDSRRGPLGVGRRGRARLHLRSVHGEPGRGLRAVGGQPGVQRALDP